MSNETKTQAFVWDEHEEPQEILGENKAHNSLEQRLMLSLRTKEYGKLVRTYPAYTQVSSTGELALHFRAFTDEHRGRQIVSGTDVAELDANYQEQKKQCALRVFTPAELYAMKSVRTDYGSFRTVHVHFDKEFNYPTDINLEGVENTRRMETRTLVDDCSDGRRTWTLQTVWFDSKPVMVVNSSGRDGAEYHERWITDPAQYSMLVTFLKTFTEPLTDEFVKTDKVIPAMTEFYSRTIHDYYDTETGELKKE